MRPPSVSGRETLPGALHILPPVLRPVSLPFVALRTVMRTRARARIFPPECLIRRVHT